MQAVASPTFSFPCLAWRTTRLGSHSVLCGTRRAPRTQASCGFAWRPRVADALTPQDCANGKSHHLYMSLCVCIFIYTYIFYICNVHVHISKSTYMQLCEWNVAPNARRRDAAATPRLA